jgi:hypothetical protein
MSDKQKVCYTLPPRVQKIISHRSELDDKRPSAWLSYAILDGFESVYDDYYKENHDKYKKLPRNNKGSTPRTFILDREVVESIKWLSERMDITKSRVVSECVLATDGKDVKEFLKMCKEFLESLKKTEAV